MCINSKWQRFIAVTSKTSKKMKDFLSTPYKTMKISQLSATIAVRVATVCQAISVHVTTVSDNCDTVHKLCGNITTHRVWKQDLKLVLFPWRASVQSQGFLFCLVFAMISRGGLAKISQIEIRDTITPPRPPP